MPIEIGGGKIEIVFPDGDPDFPRALTQEWVTTAAGAVTKYYGRFPVLMFPCGFARSRGTGSAPGKLLAPPRVG